MVDNQNRTSNNILFVVSWVLSIYFFIIFHIAASFPPADLSKNSSWSLLLLSIFFFLLPFAKRIKLGKVFEFEKDINELKNNIGDFKEEIRQSLTLVTSSINTISK